MKTDIIRIGFLIIVLAVDPAAHAALSVSNGDFESNSSQTYNVSGWFDTLPASPADWWQATWAGPTVSPNGTSVLGLSCYGGTHWAYQSIGINDPATNNLTIQYDVGSFTDAGGLRDIGLTFSIYESDGSFIGADDSDIDGAAGVTLLDSVTVYSGALSAGQMLADQSVSLDVSSASGSAELFLRIQNAVGSTGDPWGAVDNISLGTGTNVPPPVQPDPYTNTQVQAESFGMDRVRLLDSRFKDMQELHRTGYLAWLDSDRLLSPFRNNAGLSTQGAADLGGWEDSSTGFTRGHMAGHYLSAASKMYASTGDASYLAKIQYIVAELKKCQDALAVSEPVYGYLSAFPSTWFDGLETNPHGWNNVPFYTIHKILAGLVDAYKYCGINQALDIAIDMSDYHSWRVDQLTASQIEEMFRTDNGNSEEWGGMNEALTELYLLSNARGDADAVRHLDFAKVFERDWFINPLEADVDQLDGLHANTHVPQVVGFAHLASVLNTNDPERTRLYTAADNFWHMVTEDHSFVIGGNSYSEHFHLPGEEAGIGGSLLAWNTAETCNTYNMLKLTGELMQHSPSAEYADYYERALYNHILASISPETGMATYFVSLEPGHFKTYGLPEGSCWCCTGTGIENPAQYGQYIYQHKDDELWVNLYIPSTLDWSEQGIDVTMTTDYPNSDQIQLTLACASPVQAKVRLRIPGWIAGPDIIKVNGAVQSVAAVAGSYAELNRIWNDGDIITLTLPMNLRLDRAMDDETQVSLFYGPVLLAGDLGTDNMPSNYQQTWNQWDYSGIARVAVPSLMASDADEIDNWVHTTSTSMVFTADSAFAGATNRSTVLLKPFYDTHHTRYTVYWNLIAPTAVSTWNGGGGSSAWSTSANWDIAPSNSYGLRFAAPAGGISQNDLAAGTAFCGLDFPAEAGAFTLEGNSINLKGDVINDSANSQTINMPIVLQDGLPWYFDANGADFNLTGTLSGSGVLVKHGSSTLHLLADASFDGSIYVSEGILEVGDGGTSGSLGTIPVALESGSALILNRSDAFQFESDVTGNGTLSKRGNGTMTLLSSLETDNLIVQEGAVQIGTTTKQILAHRWSFNNNLADSVGGVTAQEVDEGGNDTTLTSSYIELEGGGRSSSDYVQLGSGLLPKDGTPVTIELWATPMAFQTWSRIFDVGSSTSDNLFMSWSQDNINYDRVEWKDTTTATANNTYAPASLGTEYHIALVIEPNAGAGGNTLVTWYVAPSAATSLGSARGSFETGNTLASLNDVDFWLGRSHYSGDNTASARYNEVRLWEYALDSTMLEQLHDLGPNDLGGLASITLTGSLSPDTALDVRDGATFDLAGTTLQISSLSGSLSAVLNLGSGGSLVIGSGGDPATVFAGSVTGSGSIEVDGILRLVGDAMLPAGITLVNNGLLDIMTWNGELPAGFVNNGSIIDQSMLQIDMDMASSTNIILIAPGIAGHNYQFQSTPDLNTTWSNVGPSHAGSDSTITQDMMLEDDATFFRLQVQP